MDSGADPALAKAEPVARLGPSGFDPGEGLECRTIRNGFYWAHIFVKSGVGTLDDGSLRHWANVAILSDFGTFGYCWSHMGEPWPAFCRDLDFHYAMGKLAGRHFYEPLDIDECRDRTRQIVLERRRSDCMTKDDARALWDALPDCCERSTFLADLDRLSDGAMYREELWDARWEQPSASARGFWNEIWPHYLATLARIEAGTDETPQEVRPVGREPDKLQRTTP